MPELDIAIPARHPGQARVARECDRFNCLMCGRRWGKTTFGEDIAIDRALDGAPVGWFSPTYKLLLEVWEDVARILSPIVTSSNKTEKQIRLVTGGVIDFWSLEDPDAGRGRKYARVVIDEAGLVRNLETAWWQAIRPTLTDLRGDAWFLGTPKGRGYFWQLFNLGQKGEKGWRSWKLPSADNPHLPADEIEEARSSMPPEAFAQEYEGEPADDGGNPFGLDSIAGCAGDVSDAEPVVWGWDLAKSVDWTVGIPLDEAGAVTDRWVRFQRGWTDTESDILALVNAPALVDATGVGDPIVERLAARNQHIEGFKFSATSKQQLMLGLRAAIHRREVRFPDGPIRGELESFVYAYRPGGGVSYSAPSGMHDDCVMALALAVHHRSGAVARRDSFRSATEPPPTRDRLAALMAEEARRREGIMREIREGRGH